MKIKPSFFRYVAYSLLIVILYVVEGTPNLLPEIFGSKPLLLVPFALAVSAKEDYIPSLVFSAVCGGLTDISSSSSIGFFAIILTLVCYLQTDIFKKYIVESFLSSTLYSIVSISVIICLYFLFFRLLYGTSDCFDLFVNHYISRIVYTCVMFVPLYFINGFLYRRLR